MLDLVSQWVSHYGYILVALFLFIEAAGVPVPGETALVTAAALAGRGALSITGVCIAGLVGTVAGGHAGYWIGRRGGRALVTRHGRWVGITEARLDRTFQFFDQHGAKTVLLGRFVAVVRSFLGVLSGLSNMPMRTFAPYNLAGGMIWVAAFSSLGFVFGRNLPLLIRYIGRASLVLALLIAVVVVVVFVFRWFERNRVTIVRSLGQTFERIGAAPRVDALRRRHPLVWRALTGRSPEAEYLAIHLVVGFLISLAVIGLFASVTEGFVENTPLTRFDVAVASRLRASVAPDAIRIFELLSSVGGRGAMTLVLLAGAVVFTLRRKGIELAGWCAAFIGGSLLDAALRYVVRRSELPFADIVLINWGTGLASGHALGVLVGFGMLAYALIGTARGTALRAVIIIAATAIVAAITVSRLYLGQHYISDAAAGLAAGFVWLAMCISGIEVARQRSWTAGRVEAGASSRG
jgi:undecaprenyl-diphosphatase